MGEILPINSTYAPVQALVDELARCGMTHAVTCPGSRNAPLALTFAAEERIRSISVIDERSAGFMALGLAKASGRPVAITCTSGTAAANLMPAVAEARESRVPLIVLTADRPPELRDVGAGQAIDQIKLYGSAAKLFVEVGNHDPGRDSAVHHRSLACRAYFTAAGGRPGPVHLNVPLREPLAPSPEELDPEPWQGRPDGSPWVVVEEFAASRPDPLPVPPRGAIVAGPLATDMTEEVTALAAQLGWPVLAEPTSGLRCGPHDRSHVVAHYDALLRSEEFADSHLPELVLRLGDTPTSKPLRAWLARTRQVVVDPHASWHEPTRMAERVLVTPTLPRAEGTPDPEWLTPWREADALVAPALAAAPDPFEPKALAAMAAAVPDDSVLWLSSSMPVRDVETFFPQTGKPLRFLANRGANGIDGVVSSAAGAALATGRPTFLLTGELSLLYDIGGLLAARRAGAELTILCLNNGGGGIFDFLPVAGHAERELYEAHVATPAGVDLARVAALVDIPHTVASSPDEVREAVQRPGLVEVRTERARNVELHRETLARVADALR